MRALILLGLLACSAIAAERVVLVEDFTNSGCGPCWSFEPTLNSFVNSHLAAGDISVIRVHTNWPSATDPIYLANPTEQQARWGFYGVNAVPTIKVDGIVNGYPGIEAAYNSRKDVPCYLDIFACRNPSSGMDNGVVSIRLIAEQDLGANATMRLFATLVEDDVPGAGYWSGSVFEQAFRDNLFGPAGPVVAFSAPYPDTLFFQADYVINPAWNQNNLNLAVFVQEYASAPNKEVMNSAYYDFLGMPTGIEGGQPQGGFEVSIAANPCRGAVRLVTGACGQSTGTATLYDTAGRVVSRTVFTPGNETTLETREAGLYLLRVEVGDQVETRSVIVLE